MKTIFTKYDVVGVSLSTLSTWRYSFIYEYAMIIKCYPGFLYRIKGHKPYKFAVVGKTNRWYYAEYEELDNGKHKIKSVSPEYISFHKNAFFNNLLSKARKKGLL